MNKNQRAIKLINEIFRAELGTPKRHRHYWHIGDVQTFKQTRLLHCDCGATKHIKPAPRAQRSFGGNAEPPAKEREMDTIEFMLKYKPLVESHSGYTFQALRPRAKCSDGTTISIQASHTHYCEPRLDGLDRYSKVELGYPSVADEILGKYAETKDDLTGTVYGYVPIEIVNAFIKKHGDIVGIQDE